MCRSTTSMSQGTIGVDDEARQQIFALANQLYTFGHRKEERELELCH